MAGKRLARGAEIPVKGGVEALVKEPIKRGGGRSFLEGAEVDGSLFGTHHDRWVAAADHPLARKPFAAGQVGPRSG
jgi:hypothetical protein